VQVLALPQASVAVAVTVVIPVLKNEPDGMSVVTTGLGSQSSVAETSKDTCVPPRPPDTAISCGQVITGGVVSTTVIVWTQVETLPHSSVAVQVRVMVSVLPQPGSDVSLCVIATVPQVSVAVAWPVALGEVSAGHSRVTSGGQVIIGGVVSTTVMVWTQVEVLPHWSVAVQVRMMVFVLPQPGSDVSL